MALVKQLVPIQFSGGLDTKTDPKAIPLGKLAKLENGVFTKPGSISKRHGLTALSKTVETTADVISQGESLVTYNNQLLLFDGDTAYSKLNYADTWVDKGEVSSVINSSFQVIRNGSEQNNPDLADLDDVTIYTWEDSRGGIRYSIVDRDTGNFIVSDRLLATNATQCKVFPLRAQSGVSAQFVLLFLNNSVLQYARIPLNQLSATPVIQTLTSDFCIADSRFSVWDACLSQGNLTTDDHEVEYDSIFVAFSGQATVEEQTFFYQYPLTAEITATELNLPTHNLGNELGTIDVTVAVVGPIEIPYTINVYPPTQISIAPCNDFSHWQEASQKPSACIFWKDHADGLNIARIKQNMVGVLYPQAVDGYEEIVDLDNLTQLALVCNGQLSKTELTYRVFFEINNETHPYIQSADLSVLLHGEIIDAAELQDFEIRKGVALYSKPFVKNRQVCVVATHTSTFQDTYFILNQELQAISKLHVGEGGGLRTGLLCEIPPTSIEFGNTLEQQFDVVDGYSVYNLQVPIPVGENHFTSLKKGKLQSEENTIFTLTGVVDSTLTFSSPFSFNNASLNDNMYLVGGILQSYDGNRFTETNFHLYPEDVELNYQQLTIDVVTTGTFAVAESNLIYFPPGNRFRPGDAFIAHGANNSEQYAFWFKVDGIGEDPEIEGYEPIEINITSYYTAAEVATTVLNVLVNFLTFDTEEVPALGDNVLLITNTSPGPCNGVANVDIGQGEIEAGLYQYVCCWKYIDNAGRVTYSTTSVAQDVIVPQDGYSVSVTCPVLHLTTKDKVIFEVYRTLNIVSGTSLFRRVSSIVAPTFNIPNDDPEVQTITFIDTLSDEDIQSNELLYTSGEVLDNSSPPPCQFIATYNNRLFIAGLENPNRVQYSKKIAIGNNDTVGEFSDVLFFDLEPAGGPITGLAVLDNQLIIFKATQIYKIFGEGPENTGLGSSFSEPQLIVSDTGCTNANSIIAYPNGILFQSAKGIYLLDRGLSVSYIGAGVEDFNHQTITSANLLADRNQIVFSCSDGPALVLDYYNQNNWGTFTNYESVDAVIYQDVLHLIQSDGTVQAENANYDDNEEHYALKLKTGPIQMAGLAGFQRIYRIHLVADYLGAHQIKVKVHYDNEPAASDSVTFDSTSVIGANTYGSSSPYGNESPYGGTWYRYEFDLHLSRQKCSSLNIEVEDLLDGDEPSGLNISALVLQIGVKQGFNKMPATQKIGT